MENSSEKTLLTNEDVLPSTHPKMPSQKAQSWGALLSIIVIVLMIIIGAFYAWGERVSQNVNQNALTETE